MTDLSPKDIKTLRIIARQMMEKAEAEGRPGDMAELSALLGKLEQIERELEAEGNGAG